MRPFDLRLRISGTRTLAFVLMVATVAGCATMTTRRDKTKRGAGIGAAAGAVLGAVLGEGEADEILAGAAIGAGIGAGIGTYMDKQEDRIARIPGTTVERVDEKTLLVEFDSDVLFDFDSAGLTSASRRRLDELADVLTDYPKTAVVIQGHTDSTGASDYNQRLSERRADAVRGYLARLGVDPQRMVSLGYGEDYPVADNASEAGRAQNRRVNILLKAKA